MRFKYKAKTSQGEPHQGEINATNRSVAIESLQREGLVLLSLEAVEEIGFLERFFHFGKPRLKEVMILSRQIAILFGADVPILSSLKAVTAQSGRKRMKKVLQEVFEDVDGGLPLSGALEKHPSVFGNFYINLVRSGESSGRLSETFSHLADYLERSYELVSKVRNAMIYPAFILVAFIAVMVVMLTVVMPKLNVIFKETGVDLPIFTKIIIAIGVFVNANGWWLLILLILGILFFLRYLRTVAGRELLHKTELRLPLLKDLFTKFYVARFADNFATLIMSGVPIIKSLEISAEVVENEVYRRIILQAAESIRGGGTVAEAFEPHPEIPPLVVQMITIGEQTGKLDYILGKISTFYSQEVNNIVNNLVALIEPALIVFLGVAVGILVVGVMLPLYNIAGNI